MPTGACLEVLFRQVSKQCCSATTACSSAMKFCVALVEVQYLNVPRGQVKILAGTESTGAYVGSSRAEIFDNGLEETFPIATTRERLLGLPPNLRNS